MNAPRQFVITAVLLLFVCLLGCYKQDMLMDQAYKALVVENTQSSTYSSLPFDSNYDPGDHPVRISAKISRDISPEKIVFITIDDGPSNITNGFLDTLKAHEVGATFFILGNKVSFYSNIVKRMYEEGHAVINHSYNHDYRYIYSSPYALINSIERSNAEIDSVIQRTETERKFFRFPGGAGTIFTRGTGRVLAQALNSRGYYTMEWNISTEDSMPGKITSQSVTENGINDKGKDVAVVLMHDTNYRSSTLEALPVIIKHYKDKGYVFRTVRDMGKGDFQKLIDKRIINVLY